MSNYCFNINNQSLSGEITRPTFSWHCLIALFGPNRPVTLIWDTVNTIQCLLCSSASNPCQFADTLTQSTDFFLLTLETRQHGGLLCWNLFSDFQSNQQLCRKPPESPAGTQLFAPHCCYIGALLLCTYYCCPLLSSVPIALAVHLSVWLYVWMTI